MKKKPISILAVAAILLAAQAANAQQPPGNARDPSDPGIRNDGMAGAGGMLQGPPPLSGPLMQSFNSGQTTFEAVETVAGANGGLGPTMNLNSCSGCHINPAVGGTSPPTGNPQVAFFNN